MDQKATDIVKLIVQAAKERKDKYAQALEQMFGMYAIIPTQPRIVGYYGVEKRVVWFES